MLKTLERFALLGLLVVLLGACKALPLGYEGRLVAEDYRVFVEEGESAAGNWRTRDVDLRYEAVRQEGVLQISGELNFAGHLTNGFSNISLSMGINFIDAEHRIMAHRPFPLVRYSIYRPELPFFHRFAWPAGAVGFTFNYDGYAWEGGRMGGRQSDDGGGSDWTFWHAP